MKQIILLNGKIIELAEWQVIYGIKLDHVGKNFSVSEFPASFMIAEQLIRVLDLLRAYTNMPVTFNSTYRTDDDQQALTDAGYRTAKVSPHPVGMAADVDTKTDAETYKLVSSVEYCASLLGIKIRIGFKDYMKLGQTFMHLDVTPMYYAKGCCFNKKDHPEPWEREARW